MLLLDGNIRGHDGEKGEKKRGYYNVSGPDR